MNEQWVTTDTALPRDGSLVEFLLDARECPMQGVYALGRFESRWYHYSATRVCRWREAAPAACAREREMPSLPQRPGFAASVLASLDAGLRGSLQAIRVHA